MTYGHGLTLSRQSPRPVLDGVGILELGLGAFDDCDGFVVSIDQDLVGRVIGVPDEVAHQTAVGVAAFIAPALQLVSALALALGLDLLSAN
jgi:hypothetical protein